jgi:hypothetical protein
MADVPAPPPPTPARRGLGLWPIALIALGVLLLAGNLGWLNLAGLIALLNYWPVALIAVGLNLLTGGRYRTPIVIAAVVLALVLWSAQGGMQRVVGGTTAAQTIAVEHELEGAIAARVTLELGVGQVRIDGAAPTGALVRGTIQTGAGEYLEEAYGRENGTAVLDLRSRHAPGTTFGVRDRRAWELSLTREVPLALRVNAGVGENRFDLRSVRLIDISFRGGVGESHLQLPGGSYAASVEVGVGATTVVLPAEAAVRATVTTGLGRANVQGDWRRDGDVYTTPGFESAAERIELVVRGGVGAVNIERR